MGCRPYCLMLWRQSSTATSSGTTTRLRQTLPNMAYPLLRPRLSLRTPPPCIWTMVPAPTERSLSEHPCVTDCCTSSTSSVVSEIASSALVQPLAPKGTSMKLEETHESGSTTPPSV